MCLSQLTVDSSNVSSHLLYNSLSRVFVENHIQFWLMSMTNRLFVSFLFFFQMDLNSICLDMVLYRKIIDWDVVFVADHFFRLHQRNIHQQHLYRQSSSMDLLPRCQETIVHKRTLFLFRWSNINEIDQCTMRKCAHVSKQMLV
jgi:hypothetical protein